MHGIAQHSTAQHRLAQNSTAQHSISQHSKELTKQRSKDLTLDRSLKLVVNRRGSAQFSTTSSQVLYVRVLHMILISPTCSTWCRQPSPKKRHGKARHHHPRMHIKNIWLCAPLPPPLNKSDESFSYHESCHNHGSDTVMQVSQNNVQAIR